VLRDLAGGFGDAGWLAEGEPEVACEVGHGGRRAFAAPATAGVGLGDDEAHFVVGGDEPAQDGGGEVGGTGESYLQGRLGRLALGEETLAQFAHGGFARLAVGAVQDQDAVEVVYLVLEDPREQT
jgi:hypothetical protein